MRKHLVIPDCQVTPDSPTDHLEWIGKYIMDQRPYVIVQIILSLTVTTPVTTNKARYNQNTGLRVIPCDCGGKMWEVIHAEAKTRRGWYCPQCKGFVKAIGRERLQ